MSTCSIFNRNLYLVSSRSKDLHRNHTEPGRENGVFQFFCRIRLALMFIWCWLEITGQLLYGLCFGDSSERSDHNEVVSQRFDFFYSVQQTHTHTVLSGEYWMVTWFTHNPKQSSSSVKLKYVKVRFIFSDSAKIIEL